MGLRIPTTCMLLIRVGFQLQSPFPNVCLTRSCSIPLAVTHTWSKPRISTPPSDRPLPRRAHTAVHYTHHLLIFGGGNGQAALNDVWVCDVRNPFELRWEEWRATGDVPVCKGYHTANLIGKKMVVYGGSDGVHSFANVHVLDIRESGLCGRLVVEWDVGLLRIRGWLT